MSVRTGEQFLIDFFRAGGNNPHWERALEHFRLAFVEPPGFDRLVRDLTPVEGAVKVVIVDGHPRSGKTWTVLKALETIIDDPSLGRVDYWTSGLDSLGVLPEDGDNLYAGATLIAEHLQKGSYKLVLLDDFLGTNELRPPGSSLLDQSLSPFLTWDREQNPWLRSMAEGSVLVMTGRSAHFMLLDMLLGLNTRHEKPEGGLLVVNPRRGLFRTVDNGEPFGAFDRKTLREVCKNNRKYHPLKDGDPDWFIIAAPLLAFDDCGALATPRDQQEKPLAVLTDEQKRLAASGLFGEDVDLVAETALAIEQAPDGDAPPRHGEVLLKLYKAYLVMVAPGLLFLDQSAYGQLGLDDEIRELVVEGLYLDETVDEFCSGRLPNEFYMIAINDHFTKHLDLAGRAFARIIEENGGLRDAAGIPGLGVRGLLERGLHGQKIGAAGGDLKSLLAVPEFRRIVEAYLGHRKDCLLHLELGDSPSNNDCDVPMRPGLAAAIGWVLHNFFSPSELNVRRTVTEWFPSRFRNLLEEQTESDEVWETNPDVAEDVRDLKNLKDFPDHVNSIWTVAAAYSAFLQWVIRMDKQPEKGGLLDQTLGLRSGLSSVQKELQIIVDDELIWAFGEHVNEYLPGELVPVEKFLKFLGEAVPPGPTYTRDPQDEDKDLQVNRLFSLAWHNKWIEDAGESQQEAREFREKASAWIGLNRADVLDLLKSEPGLLDDNLQYHWFHFITQRAVWMRDWCFQEDPDKFERSYSQISEGSGEPSHNELLGAIAGVLVGGRRVKKERLRNLLMLLGTRAARVPSLGGITAAIDDMADREHGADVREAVLQAVFELARQGFLDEPNENVTEEFRGWCKDKVTAFSEDVERAWRPYWAGLDLMTHLDLLPRQDGGWDDVVPKSWRPLVRKGRHD